MNPKFEYVHLILNRIKKMPKPRPSMAKLQKKKIIKVTRE